MNQTDKDSCFFILPFGNDEINEIYIKIYKPLCEKLKLIPNRVDESGSGKILHQQIFEGIRDAKIIIADLSFARPNCYLEAGYALGSKFDSQIILCCKGDHNAEHKEFNKDNKVHFDLSAYPILFWNQHELFEFKKKLTDKINERLEYLNKEESKKLLETDKPIKIFKEISENSQKNMEKKKKDNLLRYLEIKSFVVKSEKQFKHQKLTDAMEESDIDSGEAIGVIYNDHLKPTNEGIISEVDSGDFYDFWKTSKKGHLYILSSLDEDHSTMYSGKKIILFKMTIKRTTEVLIRIGRLYKELDFDKGSQIAIELEYGGLKERVLSLDDDAFLRSMTDIPCHENIHKAQILCFLKDLSDVNKLEEHVFNYLDDFFGLFSFPDLKSRKEKLSRIVRQIYEKSNR